MRITIKTEYDMGDQRIPYLVIHEQEEVDHNSFQRMVERHEEGCGSVERKIIKELKSRA